MVTHIECGGQFESAESAAERLVLMRAVVIAGIFFLLVTAFGSTRDKSLVMLNPLLALIGGVAGVRAAGGVVTIAYMIGFITQFGIATHNGVILVDHVRRLARDAGVPFEDAVRQGSEERLVPILMTALATALALVPLALASGQPGSEIQAPMAPLNGLRVLGGSLALADGDNVNSGHDGSVGVGPIPHQPGLLVQQFIPCVGGTGGVTSYLGANASSDTSSA